MGYYLRDTRSVVGNCVMWWRKGCAGYSCNLDEAEVFSKEEAFDHHRQRETDVPYLKSAMDKIAKRHVDHQDL